MDTLFDPFLHRFWWRALVIAACLGVSGACLGTVLVTRRLALIGDGLAHALLPGVGVAWLVAGASLAALWSGAALAGALALGGAWLLARLTRLHEDTAIAALLATSFAAGVLLIAKAGSAVDLTHALFGDLLSVGRGDAWIAGGVLAVVVWTFALGWRVIVVHAFDPQFLHSRDRRLDLIHPWLLLLLVAHLAAGLRCLGAATSVGVLLLPAATAALWTARLERLLLLAAAIAVVGAVVGLFAAWHLALPPGPAVVAVLGLGFLASAVIGARGGVLALRRHAPHVHRPG
jgi:zinc/manganese transport system permease protein